MTAADMVRETTKRYRDDADLLDRIASECTTREFRVVYSERANMSRAFADDLDRLAERIEREAT